MKQLKNKFKTFWNYIEQHKFITLCTHVEPDGDTLGSAIALKNLIELNCKTVEEVKISGRDYPRNLLFLQGAKQINLVDNDFFNKSLKIVVDTSTKSRIFDKRVKTEESLKIDHHHFENKWMFEIGGDFWPATGEIIALMIKEMNLKVNQDVLKATAVAIITDTEYFKERNITSQTFECMAFLMEKGLDYSKLLKDMTLNDYENNLIFKVCQGIKTDKNVSYVVSEKVISNDIVRPLVAKFCEISNTEVQLAILKRADESFRCEIRSKTFFDVSPIASHYGGGGHKNSSGFIIKDINKINEILDFINNKFV